MNRLIEIGSRIRRLRQAAELTQEDLAERSNLTAGFISQVERGKTSISIDSLLMILDALNIHISDFFRPTPDRIVFRKENTVLMEREGVSSYIALVPGAVNRIIEPVHLTLNPSETTSLMPFSGDQFGYVLKGKLEIKYGKQNETVEKGESFYTEGNFEMIITNNSGSQTELLWVTSPPNF